MIICGIILKKILKKFIKKVPNFFAGSRTFLIFVYKKKQKNNLKKNIMKNVIYIAFNYNAKYDEKGLIEFLDINSKTPVENVNKEMALKEAKDIARKNKKEGMYSRIELFKVTTDGVVMKKAQIVDHFSDCKKINYQKIIFQTYEKEIDDFFTERGIEMI